MIYSVECNFNDPMSEASWNDFYSLDKLNALISVTGFHSSQRFQALDDDGPIYLALHCIDGLEVLQSEEYREKGGGNFSRWQQHITDWYRNLYSGIDHAPAIAQDEYLVVSNIGPEALLEMGLTPAALHAVALDQSPQYRWLAKLKPSTPFNPQQLPQGVRIYTPMTAQLTQHSTGE